MCLLFLGIIRLNGDVYVWCLYVFYFLGFLATCRQRADLRPHRILFVQFVVFFKCVIFGSFYNVQHVYSGSVVYNFIRCQPYQGHQIDHAMLKNHRVLRPERTQQAYCLWSPYVIGQTIIFLPCSFFPSFFLLLFFPRLISAVGDWMSAILLHMAWPQCEFRMQV